MTRPSGGTGGGTQKETRDTSRDFAGAALFAFANFLFAPGGFSIDSD